MKDQLIAAGVKNLKTFGYPEVSAQNILTDRIFSAFFLEMLKENKGKGGKATDSAIDDLIKVIEG